MKFKFIKVDSPTVYSTLMNRVNTAIANIRKSTLNNDEVWIFEISRSVAALGAPATYYRLTENLYNLLMQEVPDIKIGRLGNGKRCVGKF